MTNTLISLPNEVLIYIFKQLNLPDLHAQSKTCRIFHLLTLHLLFQRHFKGFPSHKLEFDLDKGASPTLFSALLSALFIADDIRHLHITFPTDTSLLLPYIRALTALVGRLRVVEGLHLFLTRIRDSYVVHNRAGNAVVNLEKLAHALQDLMYAAFAKGCNDLTFSTGGALEPVRGEKPRRKLTDRFSGLVRHPQMILKGLGGSFSSCHSVCLEADLLFQPYFLDWTLYFLNHSHLTTLTFLWTGFSWFTLRDILPRIHMGRLQNFKFVGWMGPFRDLVLFAQRHSRALTSLAINTSCPDYSDLLTPAHSGKKATKLQLDFPKLRHLELSSLYLPWFFSAVTSNPRNGALRCLPNLSHVTIIVRSLPSSPSLDLGPIMGYISQLVRRGTGSTPRSDDWLSNLTLDLSDPPSFVAWCQSLCSGPSPTHVLHLVRSLTIKGLIVQYFHKTPKTAQIVDDLFGILPNLFLLFPNLAVFHVSSLGIDSLRKHVFDCGYWQKLHQQSLTLETVWFNDTVEVGMLDLVEGRIPPF